MKTTLENIVASYLGTAEWATCDSTDKVRGFTRTAKKIAEDDCNLFIEAVGNEFTKEEANAILTYEGDDVTALCGHDFFLTRNGHGAGFWDKPIYDELAPNGCNRLTEISEKLGTSDVYLNRGWLNF